MVKIDHEALRPDPAPEEPESLRLTEAEQRRVDLLSETMSHQEALLHVVSRSRARRIINLEESRKILKQLQESEDRPEPEGPSDDKLAELLRSTYPSSGIESDKPTDEEV